MMFLISRLCAGFLVCCITMMVAQDELPSYSSSFVPSRRQHYRASVRHIERGGIGYNQGYTTFEGFLAPDPFAWRVMPFFDGRVHFFNNGEPAVNVGLGLRGIKRNRVYGINTYYDYRNTPCTHYNQMGIGAETLGKRWDFRINGYIPFGRKMRHLSAKMFAGFSGNSMILAQTYQLAMKGFNAELGIHFGKSRYANFYVAAGPYYFTGDVGRRVVGGKVRFTWRFKDYITIEISDSYDKTFRNRFQGQVTFTMPFGCEPYGDTKEESSRCDVYDMSYVLASRMVQPVDRQEIIVETCGRTCDPAINHATGAPYRFVFVDNTSHSAGTYESPYPTLALAQEGSQPGDIIYVFPGDGTTKGMDEGITLQLNQKFWGSGIDHLLQMAQGDIIIPAQSLSAPQMTNLAGDAITLAPVNEVSGFTITDAAGSGIIGSNISRISIGDCAIDNSQSDHINLGFSAPPGTATFQNLTLTNGQMNGIVVDAPVSSLACTVNNCTIQGSAPSAIQVSFDQQATVSILNNTIEGNNAGANMTCNGPATLVVSGNTFANNTSISSDPLAIVAGAAPLFATIENNVISENVCGSIHCILNNTNPANITVNANTITNNATGSVGPFGASLFIDPNSTASGNCELHVTNNVISNNTGNSIYCFNGSFDTFSVNATGNTLTNNGGSGLACANASNTFELMVTNNAISGGGDNGIATAGVTMSNAAITIAHNTITENTNFASAIVLSHDGTDLNLIVTNNNLSNNESTGFLMYASSGVIENVTATISSNIINNNQNLESNAAGGIDLEQFTNLSSTIANNTLTDNASPGLFMGTTDPSPSVCLDLTGNSNNTGYTLSNGTGTFNVTPCDVESANVGTITSVGTITLVQSCPDAVPCL